MKGQNAWVGITPEILNQWQEESAKWKALAGELVNVLEDIRDHSGMPDFNTTPWSNYCHQLAGEEIAKAREVGL